MAGVFRSGLEAGAIIFKAIFDDSGLDEGIEDVAEKATGLTGVMGKLKIAMGTAFTAKAVIDVGSALLETSASLQALDAQFDQVFKNEENAKALEMLNAQSEELGIHADRIKSSYSQLGAQMKGAGMESAQALEATEKATRLAADAAAFYDITLEEATARVSSFMKGNFEAGDSLGVYTNAAQMGVKANEVFGKSWQDLTEAEKQWLLLDTVEKTYELNGAAGQATREQDSWANVTANLSAEWQRFLSIVGEPVLTVVTEMVKLLADALGVLVEDVKSFMGWFNDAAEKVGGFISGIREKIKGFGGIKASVTTNANVPKLATGAVIPPNSEFLAILGDQKHGTNIEAPLSTIEKAVENVLARRGGTGGGVTVLEIDGRELARVMAPYNSGESMRTGVRLMEGRT